MKQSTVKSKTPLLPAIIGTGFGAGYWPWGPGTAGALLALVLWFVVSMICVKQSSVVAVTLVLILLFQCLGIWSANKLEHYWGKDPKRVVVDEMVGVWIALLAVPSIVDAVPTTIEPNIISPISLGYAIAAFVLFRFFDIVKPFGIRHMEKMGGGVGVMMDDVLAGIYSFFILYIVRQCVS